MGSTKGKPVRGAPRLVTYIHTQMKIQHRNKTTNNTLQIIIITTKN